VVRWVLGRGGRELRRNIGKKNLTTGYGDSCQKDGKFDSNFRGNLNYIMLCMYDYTLITNLMH